jgi:addiction module RelB/DinJ family antitoxin
MTDIFRVRIERKLLKDASRVAEEIGTTPGEIVRLLFAQLVKRRSIPFTLSADAPSATDLDLVDVQRRNKILKDLDDSEGW